MSAAYTTNLVASRLATVASLALTVMTLGVEAAGCSANSDTPVVPGPSCTMPAHAFMADSNDTPGFRRATLYWDASGGCSLEPGAGEVIPMLAAGGEAPLPDEALAAFSIDDTGYAFFAADPWRYDVPVLNGSSSALPEGIVDPATAALAPFGVTLHTEGASLTIKFHFSGELVFIDGLDIGGVP